MKKDLTWAPGRGLLAALIGLFSLVLAPVSWADFINGNFAQGDFTGWTESSYTVPGSGITGTFPPLTEADLQLTASGSPMSAVFGPGSAGTTAGALAWSGHAARVHDEANGNNYRVSAIEQSITIAATDFDADGRVHVRFTAAPVLQDPGHPAAQQPYFFIEITGPGGNSLFHTYNFAGEVGVPWQVNGTYKFTDWQAFDIALDPGDVGEGDTITLKAIGAGCAQSAHAGAVYLRDVRTTRWIAGASLWITATGPDTTCAGRNISYTYTYENNGSDPMTDVMVEVGIPETDDPLATTFVGISAPSFGGGTCAGPANPGDPAVCRIGTLQPGESGTFTMTVTVPFAAAGTTVNNGNYTISGEDPNGDLLSQLGPLVRTALECGFVLPEYKAVPTLGQWMLLVLGLILLLAGFLAARNRAGRAGA